MPRSKTALTLRDATEYEMDTTAPPRGRRAVLNEVLAMMGALLLSLLAGVGMFLASGNVGYAVAALAVAALVGVAEAWQWWSTLRPWAARIERLRQERGEDGTE